MKKHIVAALIAHVIFSLSCGVVGYVYANPPKSVDVTGTSTLVLPDVPPSLYTNKWASNTAYTVGNYVYTTNANRTKLFWWCVSAGTSSNTTTWPADMTTGTNANDITDGGVTWRRSYRERESFSIVNYGSTPVFLGFGFPAVVSNGAVLVGSNLGMASSGDGTEEPFRGPVYAISESGTNTVGVQED